MSNIKWPLSSNPDEDHNYYAWKNDADVCQEFTKEKPRRRGSLKGRAKEAVWRISINDLKKDDGVEEIMTILYEIFQSDETT